MSVLAAFVGSTLLSAVCLWVAMKLTVLDGTFLAMLMIAAICALIGLVPLVGWLAAFVAMFILIRHWTDAPIWPDVVLMVIVSRLVAVLAAFMLSGLA